MNKPLPYRSPYVAMAITVAVALLGAAVLALQPAPAQQVAALAALDLVPSCADAVRWPHRVRPANAGTPTRPAPDLATTHEGPPT